MALIYVKESGKRSAAAVRATMWLCLHWRWESAWWKGLKESKGWGNQYKNVMLSVSSMFSTVHEQQWKVAWKLIQHNSFLKRSLRRNLAFFYYFLQQKWFSRHTWMRWGQSAFADFHARTQSASPSPVWLTKPSTWHHINLRSCSAIWETHAILLSLSTNIFPHLGTK